MFYNSLQYSGTKTVGLRNCIICTNHALAQSIPPGPPRRHRATLPSSPARTPTTGLFPEGDRLEAHDEVRPTAMRLPPRSFPASRPLLRMDLQSPGQDGQREAQLASRPALSGRHQTAPQTQGHAGQDGAPLANRFSSPGEASREYRLTSGCAAWSHYRLFSALRLPTVAYPACSPSLAPHRPPSGSRSDEKSGLSALDPHLPDLAVMRAQRRNVRSKLERALHQIGQPALYVIDNIPEAPPGSDPPPIADFCPALGAIAVLATSRQDTREAHVKQIPIDTLERDPAILLLTDNVLCSAALSWADWGRIAAWVGDLPIALDLLNACLALSSITPSNLLQRAVGQASRPVRELDRLRDALRGQVPKDAVRGITEAFSISFENLDGPTQQAVQLPAQLAPAPVPEAFMEALPGDLKSPAIRTALRGRHFVTGGGGLSFGVMHRLMVDFLRSAAEASAPELLEQACIVLSQIMPPDRCEDPLHWPVMRLCRPHAEALFARAATAAAASENGLAAAFLASKQGDHAGARRLQQRVLEVRTRVLGEKHPDTLTAMNNLAGTLSAQGDHPGARRLQERVLEAMTRVLGEEHPATLTSMSNLAHTLREQGNRTGARRLQERVLEARIRLLGEEHRDTLAAKNNLALTLYELGDYAGAQRLQERVLEASTRLLGEEHPDTLTSMNNLAGTLRAQGDLPAARRHHEHALAAMTRVLGEEHPDTLRSMYNLTVTVAAQGDRAGALRLLRQCLYARRKVFGENHPDAVATAKALSRLEAQPPTTPPSS